MKSALIIICLVASLCSCSQTEEELAIIKQHELIEAHERELAHAQAEAYFEAKDQKEAEGRAAEARKIQIAEDNERHAAEQKLKKEADTKQIRLDREGAQKIGWSSEVERKASIGRGLDEALEERYGKPKVNAIVYDKPRTELEEYWFKIWQKRLKKLEGSDKSSDRTKY